MPPVMASRYPSVLALGLIAFSALGLRAEPPPPAATEYWEPVPPVVEFSPNGVPSDAVVLFDGTNLDAWKTTKADSPGWRIDNGAMVVVPKAGNIESKASFGDIQLHLEFRTPTPPKGEGQSRGNSGIFFMGLYELQVLDSYQNKTYVNGQAGSVYKQYPPLVNASRPPGEWQSYDAIFTAPRFDEAGKLLSPARLTVLHNGVLVQNNVEIRGATAWRGSASYKAHPAKLPIRLQDHDSTVAFRNIWVRELDTAPAAAPAPSK